MSLHFTGEGCFLLRLSVIQKYKVKVHNTCKILSLTTKKFSGLFRICNFGYHTPVHIYLIIWYLLQRLL